jgi:16S rRNA (cytosine967-C5)-methyltransferase
MVRLPASVNPGRVAAVRALIDVEEGGHAEDVLPTWLHGSAEDRALAWSVVFGVLRRRGHVDGALRAVLARPLDELDPVVRAVLRAGAWERLFGRAPAHAVVDQAVEALRVVGGGRASSMVNAVLRRVAPVADLSPADTLDHPAWLVERWASRYGGEVTARWCAANAEPPPLFVAARHDVGELAATLRDGGLGAEAVRLHGSDVPGVLRVEGAVGRVDRLPGFAEGRFWVQDAASAWMTDLVPGDARRVLDACAAPGGKTFRLATRGAEVTATDVDAARLARVDEGARRLGLTVRTRETDWTLGTPPGAAGVFDAVLVDAPCTGLGTVRRHPEIRWRRGPLDPGRAARRQLTIARHALAAVRPGGVLVYVVCSPEPEEGPQVVDALCAAHPGLVVEATRCTAPPEGGEDAFFGARLRVGALP